jgi:hypothetical protein
MDGLYVSQQFFGIWLRETAESPLSLVELCAVLNSPLANAFSFVHDEERRFRVEVMKRIPIPQVRISREIDSLVADYMAVCEEDDGPLFFSRPKSAADLLLEIDAMVLKAYDLPPKLERELLRFMNEGQRPSRAAFGGYPGTGRDDAAIPLHKRLVMCRTNIQASWRTLTEPFPKGVADVFGLA